MRNTITKLFTATVLALVLAFPVKTNAQLGCPPPTGLSSSNIDLFEATLDWNTSFLAQNSLLEIRVAGTNTWIPIPVLSPPPFTVQPLLCGTDYEWRVSAVCQLGPIILPSNPSPIQTFTTLECNNLCPAPSAITAANVNENSAELSWTPAFAFLTDYNVRYREVGAGAWTDVNNVNSPVSLSNLNCNTEYEWQVQTLCPNPFGNPFPGAWTSGPNFTTDICAVICDAPTGLAANNMGLYSADLSWNNAAATGATYDLRYRVAGTSNWILVQNVPNPFSLSGLTCNTSFEWGVRSNCSAIPGATSAFSSWTNNSTFMTLACTTPCPAPGNLSATNISLQTADLSWSTSATPPTTAQLRYRETGTTAWTLVNNVVSPYTVSGLNCKVSYDWQVRTACQLTPGNTTYSSWSGVSVFTTLDCNAFCPGPIAITTDNITLNSAEFTWNVQSPLPVTFQLRYREIGATTFTFVNNAVSPYVASNLNCDAGYEWQIRTVCGASAGLNLYYSPWSVLQNFSTLSCNVSCPGPDAMNTSNIGLYNASLNWSVNAPGPVGFDIRYRLAGAATWTQVDNVTSPYALANLTCSSNYEWEVRTVCGNAVSNDPYSAWSATQSFTTGTCNLGCVAPVSLAASNITESGADLSWVATTPGNVTYQLRYRQNSTSAWSFLNNVSSPASVSGLTCGTDYQWQVRTVCGTIPAGPYSGWSVLANFSTAACPASITLFPNPATDLITIAFDSEESVQANIEMRDMFGKVVYSSSRSVTEGQNSLNISTMNLKEGWYSVTLNTTRISSTTKVLINR